MSRKPAATTSTAPASDTSPAAIAAAAGRPAATDAPALPAAGTAPTLQPDRPDTVTDIPVAVAAAASADIETVRLGDDAAGRPFVERPPTDIGAFRQGHEGRSASVDGVHGRGTMIDNDRTTRRAEADRFLSSLSAAERAEFLAEMRDVVDSHDPTAPRSISAGTMVVSCATRRRRGNLAFGPTPVELSLGDLTADQIAAIEGDPLLTVKTSRRGHVPLP